MQENDNHTVRSRPLCVLITRALVALLVITTLSNVIVTSVSIWELRHQPLDKQHSILINLSMKLNNVDSERLLGNLFPYGPISAPLVAILVSTILNCMIAWIINEFQATALNSPSVIARSRRATAFRGLISGLLSFAILYVELCYGGILKG